MTVCACAACHFAGGERCCRLERELGIHAGEKTADGWFTLETHPMSGPAPLAPAVRIDTLVYGPILRRPPAHLVGK